MHEEYEGTNVAIRYPDGAIYIAHIARVTPTHFVFGPCVWVASTGRLGEFYSSGAQNENCEYEPMPEGVCVPRAHAEVAPWAHNVPTEAR